MELVLHDEQLSSLESYCNDNGDGRAASQHQHQQLPPQQPTAGYLRSTFASSLPTFCEHREVERVTNSFHSGSCWSLKKLPSQIAPGKIHLSMHKNATSNLLPTVKPIPSENQSKKYGYYKAEDFYKNRIVENNHLEEGRIVTETFCRKPFITSSRQIHFTEDLFGESCSYPTSLLGPSTGATDFTKITRADVQDKSKHLSGVFHSNVSNKNREKERNEAGLWTKKMFIQLQKDWPHLRFKVKFTSEDELLIQFIITEESIVSIGGTQNTSKDLPRGHALVKYMQQVATHGMASAEGLRKRGDRWGCMEEGTVKVSPSITATTDNSGAVSSDSEGTFTVIDNEMIEKEVKLLTFSFFAPWSNRGKLEAAKIASFRSRMSAIKYADKQKMKSVDKTVMEESTSYASTYSLNENSHSTM